MNRKKSIKSSDDMTVRTPWGYVVLEDAMLDIKKEIKELSDKLEENLSNLQNIKDKQAKKSSKIDNEAIYKLQSQIDLLIEFKEQVESKKVDEDTDSVNKSNIMDNESIKNFENEINELKGVTNQLTKNLEKISLRLEKMQRVVRMIAERLEAQ